MANLYHFYFYCKWGDVPDIVFSENITPWKLAESHELGNVRWRGTNYIVHLVSYDQLLKKGVRYKYPLDLYGLLKSNLQKQVRRGDVEAVTTAYEMWNLDPFELLRRIPVIAFEDSMPSTELMTIVWMMAVISKGYILGEIHRNYTLSLIERLVREDACLFLNLSRSERFLDDFDISTINNSDPQRSFIISILFRCSYGGLPNDPKLMRGVMHAHLKKGRVFLPIGVRADKSIVIPPFKIISTAVDHHIHHKLVPFITKRYTQYSEEDVKTCLWECSSSTNKRRERGVDCRYREMWDMIRDYVWLLIHVYVSFLVSKYYTIFEKFLIN